MPLSPCCRLNLNGSGGGADRGIEGKKRKGGAERPVREKNKVLWSGTGCVPQGGEDLGLRKGDHSRGEKECWGGET